MNPLLILLAAAASAPLNASFATRAEVAAQRAALEQRFDRDKAECAERFAVTPCLEDVRKRRQEALAPLIEHEHELAALERRARAQAQVERVKARELAAAQDEAQRLERAVKAPPPTVAATPAPRPSRQRSPEEARRAQARAASQAQAEAAQRVARAKERERLLQERQAEHAAREQRRSRPAAKPLPLPSTLPPASAPSAPT